MGVQREWCGCGEVAVVYAGEVSVVYMWKGEERGWK